MAEGARGGKTKWLTFASEVRRRPASQGGGAALQDFALGDGKPEQQKKRRPDRAPDGHGADVVDAKGRQQTIAQIDAKTSAAQRKNAVGRRAQSQILR